MKIKIVLLSLILLVIISFAFTNHKNDSKYQYAVLKISYFGGGSNFAQVTYENGEQEDLGKKFNFKFKGNSNTKENFPDEVRSFKYLNEKGYNLISHACYSNTIEYSYIFMKGN